MTGSSPRRGRAAAWTVAALAVVLPATFGPRARHAAAPPLGHTGGFDEPTCVVCHSGAPLNPPGAVLGVEGLPAAYEPEETYRITVVLAGDGMLRGGFQAAVRYAGGPHRGRQAGRLVPVDLQAAVSVDSTGIEYAHHTLAGTPSDVERSVWSVDWTAPSPGGGPVVVHVAANSANGDDSPLSDLIYHTEIRVPPAARSR